MPSFSRFSPVVLLLHNDRHFHALMDCAVDLKCSCCIKWANCCSCVTADLDIVDLWCARFNLWLGDATIPGAIGDDMYHHRIVYQIDALTFVDGDGCLLERQIIHVNDVLSIRVIIALSDGAGRDQYRQ